jgi:hypothetical protein
MSTSARDTAANPNQSKPDNGGSKLIALFQGITTRAQGKSKHYAAATPERWHQIAQLFRRCNAPRWNDDDCPNSS